MLWLFLFAGLSGRVRADFCEMGCKCPAQGDVLLDCSGRGLVRLPSSASPPPLIEELDLSSNKLLRIDNNSTPFAHFGSLTLLRLSHNHLEELGPALLTGLAQLRVLEAGHNSLRGVAKEAFRHTPRLLELRLQYNPLFALPEDMLQFLPQLKRLDLQDTGLVGLPPALLLPVPRLEWLSLAHNAFERVPARSLSRATALRLLDLSDNDFPSLVRGDFYGLSSVRFLYLNDLRALERVDEGAFVGLRDLRSLSLAGNPRLALVNGSAFGNASEPTALPADQLHLRQNALRSLSRPVGLSPSLFVDLSGNPWRCDCGLRWMKELTEETQADIVCAGPSRLSGCPLSAVGPSDLRCGGGDTWWPLLVLLASGLALLAGASAAVCARTPAGLWIRARGQFSYARVEKATADLEWDPTSLP